MAIGFVAQLLHLAAAFIWLGGVFFVTFAVLPAARDGHLDYKLTAMFLDRFEKVSIASALVLFVTGGHLAGTRYTVETLTGTVDGYLVLVMLLLWAALLGSIQIGKHQVLRDAGTGKIREPAGNKLPWFWTATALSVLLIANAALLGYPGGVAGLL